MVHPLEGEQKFTVYGGELETVMMRRLEVFHQKIPHNSHNEILFFHIIVS